MKFPQFLFLFASIMALSECSHAANLNAEGGHDKIIAEKSVPSIKLGPVPFRKSSSDGKVIFYDQKYLEAYENLSRLNSKSFEELSLYDPNGKERSVSRCSQFNKARAGGFSSKSRYGFNPDDPYMVCNFISLFQSARKPTNKLDEQGLLGKIWEYFASTDGKELTVSLWAGTDVTSLGMGYEIKKNDATARMLVLAVSDFDWDGTGDALVYTDVNAEGVNSIDQFHILASKNAAGGFVEIADCDESRPCSVSR